MYPLQIQKDDQKVYVTLLNSAGALVESVTSPTIEISKNGAAYAAPSDGTWAEVSDGDYTVTLGLTDTDAPGYLALRVIKTGTTLETKVFCAVGIDPVAEADMHEKVRVIYFER